jgi:CubicO group peptidase (beta-lactamase class C family)
MTALKTFAILLLLITTQSCAQLPQKKLVRLPVNNNHNLLDSSQAEIVFKYAQHFPNRTQMSICIITGEAEKYVGIERRNDSLIYIDNRDSIFEIGSITKSFTGIMLAKLVYDGKVNPNEPIKNILPVHLKQSSLNGSEITLVHLANHTSGLPFEPGDVNIPSFYYNLYDPYRCYTIERLYDYLSNKMVLQSTPGEIRKYSNLDLALLGHILTLITGKSYEQLLFETICNPLGMKNTFVTLNDGRKRLMVQGRDEKGNSIICSDTKNTVFVGVGGIKSTVKDLVKYLRANMNDTTYFFLAQKTTKITDEHLTESLGWETYSEAGKHHVGAFGATGGYTSGIIFERNTQVGVVVLTNVSAYLASQGSYTDKLCRGLYDPLPFATKQGN